ncbi:MAG: Transcriptional regulator, MarR family [uncultured Nocardioidaceae bacterium]|uniref:Transcriptional regulator, MarR family n=1 Tax=uncultured Nocardioidaceae bacterium TaxID=253824 RepID=A0A6J4NHA2_9ACTN|nr:MAG: Transcriptional regulator, MarR family [uncultured Nocardioidaceae bacterium]
MPVEVVNVARTNAGLASSLRVSLMRLSRRLRSERGSDEELTLNHMAVLGTLWREGPLTIGELAAREKVQPPSMTRTVTQLCEKGLLARAPHADDRRIVMVALTSAADSVIAESLRRKEMWLAQRLTELTPAERQILRQAAPILERLSLA